MSTNKQTRSVDVFERHERTPFTWSMKNWAHLSAVIFDDGWTDLFMCHVQKDDIDFHNFFGFLWLGSMHVHLE